MCDISGPESRHCFKLAPMGIFIATAGQRIDPSVESTFVWRETVADTRFQTENVFLMNYTNWDNPTGQPDNQGGNEACVNIWPDKDYRWNDYTCSTKMCFICEIDLPPI